MYDELIKNLRHDSGSALQNCEFDFVHDWMLKAADAIEELLASCKNFEAALKDSVEECEKLQQYADLYKDLTEKSQKVATELKRQLQKSEEDNVNLTGWLAEEHAKHRWIPVTERLPDVGKDVLCFCRANICLVLGRDGNLWREGADRYYMSGFVTHWMPLPQPPESDGEP